MFSFDIPIDLTDEETLSQLAGASVNAVDGRLGRLSHVIVDQETQRVGWVLVEDHDSALVIPVAYLESQHLTLHVHLPLARLREGYISHTLTGTETGDWTPGQIANAIIELFGDDGGTSPRQGSGPVADDHAPVMETWASARTVRTVRLPGPRDALHSRDPDRTELPEWVSDEYLLGLVHDVRPIESVRSNDPGLDLLERPRGRGWRRRTPPDGVAQWATFDESAESDGSSPSLALIADLPERVQIGTRFAITVSVTDDAGTAAVAAALPGVSAGTTLTVTLMAPSSFEVHGDLTRDIPIPQNAEVAQLPPIQFVLTATAVGTLPIRLVVFAGGTYVARLEAEVTIGARDVSSTQHVFGSLVPGVERKGEFNLQVHYDKQSQTYTFSLSASGLGFSLPSAPIQGDLRDRIQGSINELDTYARNEGPLNVTAREERIKALGFELWNDLVPERVRNTLMERLDSITQLTILSDYEVVPWELLYPQRSDGSEPGFLVELFPVVRWVMSEDRWRSELSLTEPEFVVSSTAPTQANAEIAVIAKTLGVKAPRVYTDRAKIFDAIRSPNFTCLHFACHNEYEQSSGSYIAFVDGDLRPSDLARMRTTRPLAPKNALVFLNACRTEGASPVYTQMEHWAEKFLNAGATAVIGTSWAVRDGTARTFADTIYRDLAKGKNLGQAVHAARLAAKANAGDPTWLAYIVYGDPMATVQGAP